MENQETINKLRRIYKESTNETAKAGAKAKLEQMGVSLTDEKPKGDLSQDAIDKLRRIYRESTNETAKAGAKKKLEDAGVSLSSEVPKKKTEMPKSKAKPKAEPKAKAEPKKPSAETKDPYDCDDLIKQAKERKAKAKANAVKRANAPKKTPATKNKEAVEKTTTKVAKSVEVRAKKGEVKVAELEKLIAEYEEAIKKLKALLSKVKSGKKFAKGGNMGMMDTEDSKEFHKIKDHHCECGGKMAKGGNTTIIEEISSRSFKDEYYEYEMIVVSKDLNKDGGKFHKDRFLVSARNIDEAKKIATELWEKEFSDSDLSIEAVFSEEAYKNNPRFSKYAKGGTTESADRKYSALKSGKRTSRKYASVEMRGGGVYHRRNANQYGRVKGGKTYYEYSENRTDSRRYLAKGGNLSSKESLLFFVENEMSSGMIANKCDYSDYKTIDKIKAEMVNILKSDGDRKYSIAETNKLVSKAVKNLGL
jgi:chemotaxis protein histidine kinase CheA